MKEDLLKKAKRYRERVNLGTPNVEISKEEIPLILAYLYGEISTREYAFALELKNPGNITHRVPVVLKEMIMRGWITIKTK